MKYLQNFSLFESRTSGKLTKKQEAFLDRYTDGTWSVNSATGLVDVEGRFDCSGRRLKSLYGIQFGTVTGNFYCRNNQLTNLVGAPQTVKGSFWCEINQLTTLVGAPRTVGGDFDCDHNQLTTLTGAPQTVKGRFNCAANQLTTLEEAPQTVTKDFYCFNNQLTTLEGAPQTVEGDFFCHHNQLTTLEGAPQTVTKGFYCTHNQLTSLEGAPQTVGRGFSCSHNQLTTLEGAPETVEGNFWGDAFDLGPGQWNLAGWLEVLRTGSPEAQNLISTIIGADYWNSEISSNPVGTLLRLATLWDRLPEDIKGGIKIPPDRQNDFDNFLDLERAGVF
jgi:hypothetical protein